MNRKFDEFEELPNEFTIALLAIVAHWYENRQIQSADGTMNELPYVFSDLLDESFDEE